MFQLAQAKEIAGLWISPVGVVEEEKLQVIPELTLGNGATVRK